MAAGPARPIAPPGCIQPGCSEPGCLVLSLCRVPRRKGAVADADFGYHARSLQPAHRSHDRVGAEQTTGLMDLVQVDSADPESAGTRRGAPVHCPADRYGGIELGGEEAVLAVIQRLAEDPFAASESGDAGGVAQRDAVHQGATSAAVRRHSVDLGGVEQGDAKFQCAADNCVRLLPGIIPAVIPFRGSELPSAQPDLGYLLRGIDV